VDFPTPGPHWLGLVAALGVLLAFALWWLVTDERWSAARAPVTVAGAVLLVTSTGILVRRLAIVAFYAASGGPFAAIEHRWTNVGLAAVGVAAGLYVATYGAADDDLPDEDDDAPPAPPPIPARAWSSTEVLGDAPEGLPDDEEDLDEPALPIAARFADRGVTVPLLAVAVALGLPATALIGGFGESGAAAPANADRVFKSLLSGVVVGVALLGAALALDVWERRLAAAAFALVALGAALGIFAPDFLGNQYWSVLAWGLSAGLLAPAALRVLHRPLWGGRWPLIVGVAASVLLLGANDALSARAQRTENFGGDVNFGDTGDVDLSDIPTDVPTQFFPSGDVVVP
jgi:hypothetical protein